MRPLALIPYYIYWHYRHALLGVIKIIGNYIWFFWHFFSIGILFGTLFEPWQRLHEEPKHGFDLEATFSRWVVNTVMRLVGAIVRLTFVVAGLLTIALTVLAGIIIFVFWLLLPFLIAFFLILGLVLIVRPV